MTVKELYDLFKEFKTNEFAHLKRKVDWIFALLIGALVTLLINFISKTI